MKEVISQIKADFRAGKHSPYFPVSVYEAPGLLQVFNRLLPIFLVTTMILSYSIAVIAESASSTYIFATLNDLLRNAHRIDQRFVELQRYDGKSGYQYLAIFFTSVALGTVGGVFQALIYIRMVIIPKHATKSDARALWGFSASMLFFFAIIWVTFFDTVEIAGIEHIGMTRIFVWPIFPAVASLSSFAISGALFTVLSTTMKLISNLGVEKNGLD